MRIPSKNFNALQNKTQEKHPFEPLHANMLIKDNSTFWKVRSCVLYDYDGEGFGLFEPEDAELGCELYWVGIEEIQVIKFNNPDGVIEKEKSDTDEPEFE